MSYTQDDGITLKNKLGATTNKQLDDLAGPSIALRLQAIRDSLGPPLSFDAAHLKALHRQIFKDVFEWAGHTRDERVVLADGTTAHAPRLSKVGRDATGMPVYTRFADGDELPDRLANIAGMVRATILSPAEPLTRIAFANAAADIHIAINTAHPFREGNGRTQRAFMFELARAHGFEIANDILIERESTISSIAGANGDLEPKRALYRKLTDPDHIHAMRAGRLALAATGADPFERQLTTTMPGVRHILKMIARTSEHFIAWTPDGSPIAGWLSDLPRPLPVNGDLFEITPAPRPSYDRPIDKWLVQPIGKRLGIAAPAPSFAMALAVADPAERTNLIAGTRVHRAELHRLETQFASRLTKKVRAALAAGDIDTLARLTKTPPRHAQTILDTHRAVAGVARAIEDRAQAQAITRGPGFSR